MVKMLGNYNLPWMIPSISAMTGLCSRLFRFLRLRDTKRKTTTEVYIEPGHKIPLENPRDDLEELVISDNIIGSAQMMDLLMSKMQQVDSIHPPAMGATGPASTTATAVAGAEQHTDIRSNYKALTFENTFLIELYWMILNMTWTFAHPSTGEKLMGDKVVDFHPEKEYYYKPLSQSIEPEHSKVNKIQDVDTALRVCNCYTTPRCCENGKQDIR